MITNDRNSYGHKDQGDCYRMAGKLRQWVDEACTNEGEFDQVVNEMKLKNVQYRITRISDGRRLFINFEQYKQVKD